MAFTNQLTNASELFSKNTIDIKSPRSRFDRSSSVKTSFNVGDLVPIYVDEVLPGDTYDVDLSYVTRLQTLITPPFDNLFLDTYFFFVPCRLLDDTWRNFMGESDKFWKPSREFSLPLLHVPSAPTDSAHKNDYEGTLLDYFGLPTHATGDYTVNRMPFNAYSLIWNEFFRDENLIDPVLTNEDEGVQEFNKNYSCYGGKLLKGAKIHDYFTSCLPDAQRGDPATINGLFGHAPVMTAKEPVGNLFERNPLLFGTGDGSSWSTTSAGYPITLGNNGAGKNYATAKYAKNSVATDATSGVEVFPINLFADMTKGAPVTINDLRLAFATQQLMELDALGGSRYTSILLNHFGTNCPDAEIGRPQLLSANRIDMNISQVVQQSSTDTTSPLGTTAAMSQTSNTDRAFFHSFTEHGFVLGLTIARYHHTYGQGIERFWSRRDRLDYYWPTFANIGNQPVYKSELFLDSATGGKNQHELIFGFQEAWADYRTKPSICTGEMRVDSSRSLDVWHFADEYKDCPSLSEEWILEDKANVDRTLAVTSKNANQIFGDFYIRNWTTRVMPVHSIPGLERM